MSITVQFHVHGYGEFDPAHPIPACVWPHFDLLSVHTGRLSMTLQDAGGLELTAGQSLLIYPRTKFEGISPDGITQVSVQHFAVGGDADQANPLTRLLNLAEGYEHHRQPMHPSTTEDIRRSIALAHAPATPLVHPRRVAILTLILCELWTLNQPHQSLHGNTDGAIDYPALLDWLTGRLDQHVSLDEMAEFTGLSTSHFRALFTRQMRQSPGHFLRHTRQSEAARLLRETRLPIKEIARKLGYEDLGHFYRFFSSFTPMTPREYRQKYQLRG